jgi:hypothetical protein
MLVCSYNFFALNYDRSSPLVLDRESKGLIDYSATFHPIIEGVTEEKVLDHRML